MLKMSSNYLYCNATTQLSLEIQTYITLIVVGSFEGCMCKINLEDFLTADYYLATDNYLALWWMRSCFNLPLLFLCELI